MRHQNDATERRKCGEQLVARGCREIARDRFSSQRCRDWPSLSLGYGTSRSAARATWAQTTKPDWSRMIFSFYANRASPCQAMAACHALPVFPALAWSRSCFLA